MGMIKEKGEINMYFIPCSLDCSFQKDGNCALTDTITPEKDMCGECPFYRKNRDMLYLPGKTQPTSAHRQLL